MLWSPKQLGDWNELVKPGYSTFALGFNEPNQAGQSDMDPGYAAQVWNQYVRPKRDMGYTLISPACTNAPSGFTWMHDSHFLFECVCLHY